MDALEESIANAAQTLQRIIEEARRRQDGQGAGVVASPALLSALWQMHRKVEMEIHWPIAWPTWPPGLWAKCVALWQKVTRRMLRWYINPIVQNQHEFNHATLDAVQLLAGEVLDLRAGRLKDSAEQRARLEALAAQLETLQRILEKES